MRAQNLREAGLGAMLEQAPLQPLSAAAQAAGHCWAFCEGWAPERWPVYEALFPVADWHHHIELMQAIKAARESQE